MHRLRYLALLAVLPLATACGSDDLSAEAPVIRETLPNGATLLRYAELPEPAADSVAIDLQIGVMEGAPHEMFGSVRSIEVDGDGSIYVLDNQASEVRVFDADGQYLRTLTRKGQGPGELVAANGMRMLPDGTLWVQDHGQWRMISLNRQGEELERHPMYVRNYSYYWNGSVDDRGRFWKPANHSTSPRVFPPESGLNEETARSYLNWFDPGTGAVDSVFIGDVVHRSFVIESGGGWSYRGIPFEASTMTVVDPAGGFWTTSRESYRIARLDESGDTTLVIQVDLAGDPVTGDDRSRYVESVVERDPELRSSAEEITRLMPATKPLIEQLLVDDEGRLWVRRVTADEAPPRFDVFSRDGEYLTSVSFGFQPASSFPMRIRNGNVYTLITDDLEVPSVVRARVPQLIDVEARLP